MNRISARKYAIRFVPISTDFGAKPPTLRPKNRTGNMIRKHSILLSIAAALSFLLTSTTFYPGGSQHDQNSGGFSWQHNYLCNLLNPLAVNGQDNAALPWAIVGMLFLCLAVAVFFVRFSEKMPDKGAAKVVKYAGVGSMFFAVFAATP